MAERILELSFSSDKRFVKFVKTCILKDWA